MTLAQELELRVAEFCRKAAKEYDIPLTKMTEICRQMLQHVLPPSKRK